MTHGPDAVHELVEDSGWSYPVSVRRLEREHALANVQLDERGNSIMLAELLSGADVDRFESREDLDRKLRPVFEAERKERATGVIGRLKRSLLGRW
ncbi:hypothetical protein [Halegenticoccus soli]|uniref:hypothetical protein n=1 Tax=Halegenticoccus soli TaxID=1985678 RepID=UPI000C6D2452|nr:hypothetical protein [Halegenticoccus soli]